jgi:uncharacterized phage protein gp47/JayE
MSLNIKTRDQFVTDEVAAIEASAPGVFQFPEGSIVRAIVDAHGSTAIWEQSLVQLIYNRERLSTSTGEDADSFVADFGLTRIAAEPATGEVTFASFVNSTQRLIPVGSIVSTQDGSISFSVIADTTNPNFNSGLDGYVIDVGTSSIDVPVQANTAGVIGNVAVNTITVINSPITGVDTVTNALAFDNGQDSQTDAQLRQYFIDYLNSLSKATKGAIEFAVESVNGVTEYIVVENTDYDTDTEKLGYFYVIVDNGTGTPPSDLLAGVTLAVDAVRGLTIRFEVKAPVVVLANITATIDLPAGYSNPTLASDVQTALQTYINLIPFGETLFYTRIAQIIYNALQDIVPSNIMDEINVTSILLNGGTSNLTSTTKQAIKPGTITINLT